MRITLVLLAPLVLAAGCGPLLAPMVPTLRPEDQKQVDLAWQNMLTPVARTDRQVLLDAVVANWLFTLGVDRMHAVSEKYVDDLTVRMEMDCDLANPAADAFTITVVDAAGRTRRRERFTRADVEESSRAMFDANLQNLHVEFGEPCGSTSATRPKSAPASTPATQPMTPEEQALHEQHLRRAEAARAATQPARVTPERR